MWTLSRVFQKKWIEAFGYPLPASSEIEQMINHAVTIQKQMDLRTPKGQPVRMLATYWHPERGIVLKVDHETGKIVTMELTK